MNSEDVFFNNPDEQKKYIERMSALKTKFIDLYGEYDAVLHDWYIIQIARSEIIIDRLERMVANDNEGDATLKHLTKERAHLNSVQEQMQVSIRSMRGDKSKIEFDASNDFKSLMSNAMLKHFKITEENKNESE